MTSVIKIFFKYILLIILIGGAFGVFASTTNGTIDAGNHTALLCMNDICSVTTRINFLTTNGRAVHVTNSALTGEIWSEQVGWINLNPTNSGVANTTRGILSGDAWGENAGWINFDPYNGGVVINNRGEFVGFAWSQNYGWIKFDCTVANACVKTDWRPSNDGGGGGGPPVVDICPNIAGNQTLIPDGLVINALGQCVSPEQCNVLDGALKQPLDVMIIIDKSGSMAGTKLSQAKTAATAFINNLVLGSDRVGYVSYSTTATLENGLTTSFDTIKAKIASTVSNGNTNIGGAARIAYQEMLINGRAGVKHVIIILTDGQANVSDVRTLTPNQYAINQSDLAKLRGMIVYSIGLGTDVDSDLLSSMATLPSYFYNSPTGSDLSNIYLQIAAIECTAAPSKVFDTVIYDANRNGLYDTNERGLAGSIISLTSSDGSQQTRTMTTLADGSFLFDAVTPGNYSVCNTSPSGMYQTKPVSNGCFDISVVQGINVTDLKFLVTGNQPFCSLNPNDPSCDVCPNISGIQSTIPNGFTINSSGNCVPTPTFCEQNPTDPSCNPTFCENNPNDPSCDVCPNISGTQSTIPDGYTLNSSGNCVPALTFCEQNPTDPSCITPTFCSLHPSDSTCVEPSFCTLHPTDPSCITPTFCTLHPNDPSCTTPSFCALHPTDPSCINPTFCSLHPTNILCVIKDTTSGILETINGNLNNTITDVAKNVAEATEIIFTNPVGKVVTKIVETTGAVTGAIGIAGLVFSGPIALADAFLIPIRLWSLLLALFGIKKRKTPWGTVYDSVTKQPLDPAYVVLQNLDGKEVATSITDLDGRYGFLVPPGAYRIIARKTNYEFPSKKLLDRQKDELYDDLYFNEIIEVKEGGIITRNIPMDPIKFDWNEFAKRDRKLMKFYSRRSLWVALISDILFFLGLIISTIATIITPVTYNIIVLVVYLVLLILRGTILKPRIYGLVNQKENKDPLSFAIMRIFFAGSDHEIAHKVTDQTGRYYCLVPNGRYYTKIEVKNPDESYSLVHISDPIEVKKGYINKKFEV